MKRVGNFVAVLAFAWGGMSLPASGTFNRCKLFIGTADAIIKSNAVEIVCAGLARGDRQVEGREQRNGPAREIAEKPRPFPMAKRGVPRSVPAPRRGDRDLLYAVLEGRGVTGRL